MHCTRFSKRQTLSLSAGFSMLELLLVCAIAAALASMAAPAFRDFTLNAQRAGQINDLVHALHSARGAAIRRSEPVVLCKSADGKQCTPNAQGWERGWIVFANRDGDTPPKVGGDEPVLLRQPQIEGLSIQGNRDALVYWPFSRAGTTASFVFCDERRAAGARAIVVSQTGRPRVSDRDASGKALQCP